MTTCPKCGYEISCMGQVCPGCMAQVTCEWCGGKGTLDSGGVTPWGSEIMLPCPHCTAKWDELVTIGASWRKDSSLEKWFPITAEELSKYKELNEDKAKTIAAYCSAASLDKWKVATLIDAIDRYLSSAGYSEHTLILTHARAEVVNAKPNP